MMKKMMLVLVICILAVSAYPCAYAADSTQWSDLYVQEKSICVFEGNVYAYVNQGLQQVNLEQKTAWAVSCGACEADHLMLIADTESVLGVDEANGALWQWNADDGWAVVCQFEEWTDRIQDESPQILGCALSDNAIFINYVTVDGYYATWLFNRSDGTQVRNLGIQGSMFLYSMQNKGDCVGCIMLRGDGTARYGSLTETGIFTPWGEIPSGRLGGIAWNAVKQALWFAVDNVLYEGYADGKVQELYQMNAVAQPDQTALVVNNTYYLVSQQEIKRADSVSAMRDDIRSHLTISEVPSSVIHQKAADLLPGIDIEVKEIMFFTPDQLTEKLITRDKLIDIYFVDGTFVDAKPIFSKGYTYPISTDETLCFTVKQMNKSLTDIVTWDGQLMAVPTNVSFSQNNICVNENVLLQAEALGFCEPQSYEAFLMGMGEWSDSLLEAGIFPYATLTAKELYSQTIYQYILAYGSQNHFSEEDANMLTELLTLADKALARMAEMQLDNESENTQALYSSDIPSFYTESERRSLLLPLFKGMPKQIGVNVSFLFINPYSDHLSEAIAYLTAYLQSLPDEKKFELGLVQNGTLENAQYSANLEEITVSITSIRSLLETEKDPLTQKDLQDAIESCQQQLMLNEKNRYLVTPESLANYHAMLNCAIEPAWGVLQISDTANLLNKLMNRAISPQQYTQQFLRILEMMNTESN